MFNLSRFYFKLTNISSKLVQSLSITLVNMTKHVRLYTQGHQPIVFRKHPHESHGTYVCKNFPPFFNVIEICMRNKTFWLCLCFIPMKLGTFNYLTFVSILLINLPRWGRFCSSIHAHLDDKRFLLYFNYQLESKHLVGSELGFAFCYPHSYIDCQTLLESWTRQFGENNTNESVEYMTCIFKLFLKPTRQTTQFRL